MPDIVTARILGEETARLWRGGLLADRGSRSELKESDLVLQDDAPLADIGKDHRLEQGFPVFAGRTVFGRLQNVGRWSCTIQRVTDADFRGHAQLVRKTGRGFVFGAGGVIVGDGKDRCKLTMIPATEPVSVGDRVYTPSDAGFPYPMFYGIARYLCDRLGKDRFEVVPHVSSMQLAFARIKESWEEAYLTNLQSHALDTVIDGIRTAETVGLFTSREVGPPAIARPPTVSPARAAIEKARNVCRRKQPRAATPSSCRTAPVRDPCAICAPGTPAVEPATSSA